MANLPPGGKPGPVLPFRLLRHNKDASRTGLVFPPKAAKAGPTAEIVQAASKFLSGIATFMPAWRRAAPISGPPPIEPTIEFGTIRLSANSSVGGPMATLLAPRRRLGINSPDFLRRVNAL